MESGQGHCILGGYGEMGCQESVLVIGDRGCYRAARIFGVSGAVVDGLQGSWL